MIEHKPTEPIASEPDRESPSVEASPTAPARQQTPIVVEGEIETEIEHLPNGAIRIHPKDLQFLPPQAAATPSPVHLSPISSAPPPHDVQESRGISTTFEQALGQRGPEIIATAFEIVRVMESHDDPYLGYDLALQLYDQRKRIRKGENRYVNHELVRFRPETVEPL